MANILVTGASGQLGSELKKNGFSLWDEVFYTDLAELDITDYQAVEKFVKANDIDTIINCAAYTATERAEEEPDAAAAINTLAVTNLAKIARKEDCLLVHISTDYVFDGNTTVPYTEKDAASPLNIYGKTKLAGEEAVRRSGCFYIIIRTSWLYSVFGNNFVKNMLRLAAERSEIKVIDDQIGSPTYAGDLARAIIGIVSNNDCIEHEGIYHYSNSGECSWYGFVSEIIRQAKLDCKIIPVTAADFPSRVKRPAYSVLDTTKIKNTFEVEVPVWQEALGRMLQELRNRENEDNKI